MPCPLPCRLALCLFILIAVSCTMNGQSSQQPLATKPIPTWVFEPNQPIARWDNGYVVGSRPEEARFIVFNSATGAAVIAKPKLPDDVVRVRIYDAVANGAGMVAASAALWKKDGSIPYVILLVDSSGNLARIITTKPFVAYKIAFGPENAIWGFGATDGWRNGDYDTVRKYGYDGVQQGSYVPRSTFVTRGDPAMAVGQSGGRTQVRASGQRIGVYSGATGEWIEFDASGELVGRWKPSGPANGAGELPTVQEMALDSAGVVYANIRVGQTGRAMWRLDKQANAWLPIAFGASGELYPADSGRFLGTDGTKLVFRGRGSDTLLWYDPPR
jgi:hypothetical protein